MKKDIKNRWKYRLGKLMCVMLAATTLGGSIDAKTLADFQTETHETSEAESDKVAEATSEAESNKAAEATSEAESDKAAKQHPNPLNQRRPKQKPNRPKHRK